MMVGSEKEEDQLQRFIETARALGCDEDKERFEKALGEIARQKPSPHEPHEAKKPKPKKPGH